MMIVLLDDEPILLREGENAVRAAVPDAELRSFSLGADLLSAIEKEGLKPDVVFNPVPRRPDRFCHRLLAIRSGGISAPCPRLRDEALDAGTGAGRA